MPYNQTCSDERLCIMFHQTVPAEEMKTALADILNDQEALQMVNSLIIDCSNIDQIELDRMDIICLADYFKRAAQTHRWLAVAVIAPVDLHYGLSRMWEGYLGNIGWAHNTCRTRSEADLWLETLQG